MRERKPKIRRYPKQAPELYEKAVLDIVAHYPQLGVSRIAQVLPKIAGKPIVGYHGVQKILERYSLNTYEQRVAYARAQITPVIRLISALEELGTRFIILPVETRAKVVRFATATFFTAFATTVVLGFAGYMATIAAGVPVSARIGLFFATIALSVGSIFFAYSMKYYLTLAIVLSFSRQPLEEGGGFAVGLNGRLNNNNQKNGNGWLARIFGMGNGNGNGRREMVPAGGLQPSLEHIKLKRYPFVSIHLPFYNEKKVAERILEACTSMDYFSKSGQAQYEVMVIDDSTDETTKIVQKYAKEHNQKHPQGPKIKVLHRPTRQGFKGGALKYAVEHMDPRTEFCVVFDADFIPYPDTLELFIKYFKANNNNHSEDYTKSNVAVVGGYQWHVLNKSENWVTRGVRTEYAGSYVIERPGTEIMGLLKQISGSVYMIRADLLKKIGWGTSITEDFELTLKLYERGYKVIYTPYIQGPAECVSTLKRLIRQRMRWAEGHSNCIKKMFFKLMTSPNLTLSEKLEVLYISPYYLQAFFFLVGTFCWLMAETVFRARLPFWTSLWGWSLVLTNFFSLPLMNTVGLFLEESEEKDYLGLFSFIALSYIMVPFQAYASIKGFIEKEEGPWFRTPKTGKITDIFTRGKFYRWIAGILPGRRPAPAVAHVQASERYAWLNNPHVALATANSQFNNFNIKPKRIRWISKAALAILLIISSTILSLTRGVPEVLATNPTSLFYLQDVASGVQGNSWKYLESQDTTSNAITTVTQKNPANYFNYQPGLSNNTSVTPLPTSPTNYGWIWDTPFETGGYINSGTWTFEISEDDSTTGGDAAVWNCHLDVQIYRYVSSGNGTQVYNSENDTSWTETDLCDIAAGNNITLTTGNVSQIDFSANEYLYIEYWLHIISNDPPNTLNSKFRVGNSDLYYDPYVDMPDIEIPQNVVFFVAAAPFIPMIVLWMKRKQGLGFRVQGLVEKGLYPSGYFEQSEKQGSLPIGGGSYTLNPYLALATANSQFNNFSIHPKRLRWVSKAALAILLIISSTILSLTRGMPEVLATNPTDLFYLRAVASTKITSTVSWQYNEAVGADSTSTQVQHKNLTGAFHYRPGTLTVYSSAETPGSATGHGWIWDTPFGDSGNIASQTWTFYVNESDDCSGTSSAGYLRFIIYKVTVSGGSITGSTTLYDSGTAFSGTDILNGGVNDTSFTSATIGPFSFNAQYLYIDYWLVVTSRTAGETCTSTFRTGPTYTNPKVDMPAITIPENLSFLIVTSPFIPMIVLWMKKKKQTIELLSN